jgi:hypothetical protein
MATRTWVSGFGDDANPGSRTAPRKTFAGAISKTDPGGEINVPDPGGPGALTITKAHTIDGKGTFASVLAAGTAAINVVAGANDVVTLRHLSFNGDAGLDGIHFQSGAACTSRVAISSTSGTAVFYSNPTPSAGCSSRTRRPAVRARPSARVRGSLITSSGARRAKKPRSVP